jgi:eukaryotic-like serine/threonine-protein kinase
MGCVYEAEQVGAGGFSKRVAIKIIRDRYSSTAEFRKNFVGEACLVSDLIQANIVQIYHLGECMGQYYMVMEYVNGYTLEEFILQHRALGVDAPVELSAFIVSRVCRGLAYAHSKTDRQGDPLNIVHRDVNPRNILLSRDGEVKLTDFGIAKAMNLMFNEEGKVIAGKDEYLSPEQARREVTDSRADIFSCGVVLSELVCGENIFERENGAETRRNILNMPIPDFRYFRPSLDPRLDEIMRTSLARAKDDRYQMAGDMLLALELFLYSDGYGPTSGKLASYVRDLFNDGKAYVDDLARQPVSFGLSYPGSHH